MADIARLAGVSATTVSRALSGSELVPRPKRDEIAQLASECGYVVNATARNLRLKRTQTLSVLVPLEPGQPLRDPFHFEMLGYLADEITRHGYGMLLQKAAAPIKDSLEELIASGRADGIIVLGQGVQHVALMKAARHYRPLVVWGAHAPGQSYCTVGSDNAAGGRAAVEHLLQTGRRNIVFVGDTGIPEMRLRYEGYRAALAAAPDAARARVVSATAQTVYDVMRTFVREQAEFDGVFAATDLIAISAVRALTASARSVPQDVAVVGFDDIPTAAHSNPALTTIRQDLRRGVELLVGLLLRRLQGEETASEMLPTELIVRESTAPRAELRAGGQRAAAATRRGS
jgi:DNA-binding LacI/PurR family transcriptional regulator